MWIGTVDGLASYNPERDDFRRFRFSGNHDYASEGNLKEIIILPNDVLLLAYSKFGLVTFDPQNHAFKNIQHKINDLTGEKIIFDFALCYTSDGNIWAGSTIYGLVKYNIEKNTAKRYKPDINNPHAISAGTINSIFEDSKKNIWVACLYGGLNLYNPENDNFSVFKADNKDPYSISYSSYISIFEDSFKTLWFGSDGNGLDYCNNNHKNFNHYYHNPSDPSSLSNDVVTGAFEDEEKNIWISTAGGGLCLYNGSKHTFKTYRLPEESKENTILDLEFLNQKIWSVGWESGLNVFDPQKKQFSNIHLRDKNNKPLTKNIKGICKDNSGNLWLATHSNQGLFVYNPESKELWTKDNPGPFNQELLQNATWNSEPFVDSKNRIWIASYIGLFLWDSSLRYFKPLEGDTSSIISDFIITIFEDSKNNIWLATNDGLDLLKEKDDNLTFEHYSQLYDLPYHINSISEDNNGNLWLSSNDQLVRFNPTSHEKKEYDVHNGLPSNSFFEKAGFCDSKGNLYFGSYNGLIAFNPDSIRENPYTPSVYICDFQIFGESPKIGEPNSPLQQSIIETKEITLKHRQSYISFEYVGLNFIGSKETTYAYKMEGFDEEWRLVGKERKATYTNLDPGTYTFMVKAANTDGVWNEDYASINLIILPPWWKTILFKILAVILLLGSFLLFYRMKLNSLEKQKLHLEHLVIERTKEIEEKSMQLEASNEKLLKLNATKDKFFTIIAHDLKNPFSSVLGFSELLSRNYDNYDDEKKKEYMDTIFISSKSIYKLLEDLLHWGRSQTGAIKFKPENFFINELIDLNIQLVKNSLNEKNIKISVLNSKNISVIADKNMINTVIRNLITNAIKFTENGKITVESEQNSTHIAVHIKDSGVGIPQEKLKDLFNVTSSKSTSGTKGEPGTGLGLLICKEFVEKHQGEIWAESELEVGSTFSFTLPLS